MTRLVFPERSVVVLAGLPGAGKTTLLRRLFALTGREAAPVRSGDGVLVLDSEQARNRWGRRLRRWPYRWWRPLVYVTHYVNVWRALRTGAGGVVVPDTGTRDRLVAALARSAGRHGRSLHVVLLDVPAPVARAARRARGRVVPAAGFARHVRRGHAFPGVATVTVLDRADADGLDAIDFARALTTTSGK